MSKRQVAKSWVNKCQSGVQKAKCQKGRWVIVKVTKGRWVNLRLALWQSGKKAKRQKGKTAKWQTGKKSVAKSQVCYCQSDKKAGVLLSK